MSNFPSTDHGLSRVVFGIFLLLIFSLGFMQPTVVLLGRTVPYTDLIFLAMAAVWLIAIIWRKEHVRWQGVFVLIALYWLSMAVSAAFSDDRLSSFTKLLGETYLVSLPVIAVSLIGNVRRLRWALFAWLAGATVASAVGIASVLLYYLQPDSFLLRFTLFDYGTLPPGHYPRINSTFLNANMLCNFLSVALMIFLICRKLDWIGRTKFVIGFGLCSLCALFTISPGLGGIALSLGVWFWAEKRNTHRLAARAVLALALAIAAMFVAAASVDPSIMYTGEVRASARSLTWRDSINTFLQHPIAGRGLGENACETHYGDLSGRDRIATDAHNAFISVAAQNGLFGLAAFLALAGSLLARLFPLRLSVPNDHLRFGLALAVASGLVYQGMTGSFEDARHLWAAIGLLLATRSIDMEEPAVAR